jgi:hypothetical protein
VSGAALVEIEDWGAEGDVAGEGFPFAGFHWVVTALQRRGGRGGRREEENSDAKPTLGFACPGWGEIKMRASPC